MKKLMCTAGLLLAAAIVASGCGGGGDKENASPAQGAAAGEVKAFTIDATNFAFGPNEIKVNKGDKVSITLVNKQGNHSIKIKGYDKVIKGKQTVTFTADKAGEFEFDCDIMCGTGHADMIGKLIVQ